MIIPDIDTRNEYLKGDLVFYLDHCSLYLYFSDNCKY